MMQTAQGNTLESLRNVKRFLEDNETALADVVKTRTRDSLLAVMGELATHQVTQSAANLAAMGASQRQHALRRELMHDHMMEIARIARASFANTPEIQPLKMPRGAPSMTRLASDAFGMATAADAHAAVFLAAGLPSDFTTQLRNAAAAMIDAGDRRLKRGTCAGATAGLRFKLSAGRKIVGVLDAMVKTALKHDPSLVANWNIVKRVARVTGHSAPSTSASAQLLPAPMSILARHPGTPRESIAPARAAAA
jgi:hypothetical protein